MTEIATQPTNGQVKKSFKKSPTLLKVLPFQNMFIPEKVDKTKGIYYYGRDNRLPNKLMNWVLDSGTAKKAQSKRATYIASDGFNDEKNAALKVNPLQTADQLLNEIAGYLAFFKGFALHVVRDLNGKVIKLTCYAFQDIRKKTDGTFTYNPTLSADKVEKDKEIIIHPYKKDLTDDERLLRVQHGELIYAYNRSADNSYYPIPDYYAGIEDIRSSSELQKFDFETIMNAFMTSAILTIVGDLNDTVKDESGRTERDYFEAELEKFTGNSKDSNGVSGRMRLLIMTARNKDELPVLTPFDAKVIVDASNTKRDIIDRAVCRLFGVPPVLVGFDLSAILGNTQAIANASNELNNDVLPDQRLITEVFQSLFDGDWTVSSFRPIQFVPDSILAKLTDTEIRALVGYAPLETGTTDDKILADVLGVGGTQALTNILLAALGNEQKIAALEILFGIPNADAKRLVGVVPAPPIIPTP